LKEEWAWFLTAEVRRAEPETEPILTDLGPAQLAQISGDSKGVCPLGRRTRLSVREGEAGSRERSEADVGRGKAELFPLQRVLGRLNPPMSLQQFPYFTE